MKKIVIGNKELKNLSSQNLIDIAEIEGVHLFFEYWSDIELVGFDNTFTSNTMVVDFKQSKLDKPEFDITIVFFFDFENFQFHYHFKDKEDNRSPQRISIKTIKYLIDNGFYLPIC